MAKMRNEERVEIYLPKGSANDDPNFFVGVNGKNYLLPRGKRSMVPSEVAREIRRARRAETQLDETMDSLQSAAE